MRTLLKSVFLFFIFSILFVLPNVFIPLHVEMGTPGEYNALLLVLLLVAQLCIIVYLIKRLSLWGMKLFIGVVIVFWGLQTFMPQIETWYFREAMPEITNEELRNLFLRPLITSIIFIPIAISVLGRWKQPHDNSESVIPGQLGWKEIGYLSMAYVVIYFVFGHFIAWQFEDVRIFYSGNAANAGFFGQLKQNFRTTPFIFLFQLLRGALWIVIGLPILFCLKGSRREKMIACMILYSFPALQLIVDNPFMPLPVRMAHLLEVATSNALFGLLIGYTSTKDHN